MGWGSGGRGTTPWGSGVAASSISASVEFSALDVLAEDTILLTFAELMRNNEALQDPASYTITALDGGEPVTITSVMTGNDDYSDIVVLRVTKPTPGNLYALSVALGLQAASGNTIDPTLATKQFIGRNTKMDKALRILPYLFDRRQGSNIRLLLQVFTREDDRIGGNREDYLD